MTIRNTKSTVIWSNNWKRKTSRRKTQNSILPLTRKIIPWPSTVRLSRRLRTARRWWTVARRSSCFHPNKSVFLKTTKIMLKAPLCTHLSRRKIILEMVKMNSNSKTSNPLAWVKFKKTYSAPSRLKESKMLKTLQLRGYPNKIFWAPEIAYKGTIMT